MKQEIKYDRIIGFIRILYTVYTKKIPVGITIDKVTIKFVSVSGYNENLSDTSKNDVRINFKNYNNDFLNLFNTSVSDDTLNKILDYLKENE